ncbi:MAG: 3-beta hydroxysteroid dehydrogenase [Actinomycetota bacterium]|nr:3-beta hydroxysteroid dehydrogenase [Actinomycetota bacterium]
MVKLAVDTLATVPDDPPEGGPDRALDVPPPAPAAPPPAPPAAGPRRPAVAETDVVDGDVDHLPTTGSSDTSAAWLAALGAEIHPGALDDLDSLRKGAADSDGVVHLAYNHDFSRMDLAAQTDLEAIEAIGSTLVGTDRPLIFAQGALGLATGRVGTERDEPDAAGHPRIANARAAMAFASRGVRVVNVRFAPTVRGAGDYGFVARLVGIAREKGVSAYIDEGANRWCAVHRPDAASLVRLAVDAAPAVSVLHASAKRAFRHARSPKRSAAYSTCQPSPSQPSTLESTSAGSAVSSAWTVQHPTS